MRHSPPYVDGGIDQSNRVTADWLNGVNDAVYGAGNSALGSALLQYIQATGTATETVQTVLRRQVYVDSFFLPGDNPLNWAPVFARAIASFPNQGTPNWQPWELILQEGKEYPCTETVTIQNQQGSRLTGWGSKIIGNFDGILLQLGSNVGNTNDMLRFSMAGLIVQQEATSSNARAVNAQHMYSCSFEDCYFFGGHNAIGLDGNGNLVMRCFVSGAASSGILLAGVSNNEVNLLLACTVQANGGYGLEKPVGMSLGGSLTILGGYWEANGSGNFFFSNAQRVTANYIYHNVQNGKDCFTFGGSVGPDYTNPYITITGNMVLGKLTSNTSKFINELSTVSINAQYADNILLDGICNMYGGAEKSINLRRKGNRSYITNPGFAGGDPPTSWPLVDASNAVQVTAISPYGSPGAVQITGAGYIHQLLKFPANALLRVRGYGLTTGTDATAEMWNTAISAMFTGAHAATAASTATLLEFYITPTARSNATEGQLLLRNINGVNNAYLDAFEVEDMTN